MLALAKQQQWRRPQLPDGDGYFNGVYMRKDAAANPPGLLADGRNIRCRRGTAATRKGTSQPMWCNLLPDVGNAPVPYGTVYGAGLFKDPASLEWQIVAAQGVAFRTRENNPSTSIPLPKGVMILDECTFIQAFDLLYCFRGKLLQPLRLANFDDGFLDIVAKWNTATVYTPVIDNNPASEISYGPFQAVTTLKSVGPLATVVTPTEHGYVTGMDITVQGANQAEYNVRSNITVLDDFTFTYPFAGSATATATGTIKVSNMALYWKALGSQIVPTSITHSTTTATVHKTAHGFSNGQSVTISGATGADAGLYNVTVFISNVMANTFDYIMLSAPSGDATGTFLAVNNSVVLAGQSPDTNPEAWLQIFNIIPNGIAAAYIQDRLAVATAYNPASGEYEGKADYVVGTDLLDETHADIVNYFRVNQGSDDEIVDLWEFSEAGETEDSGTLIVGKNKSIHVINNFSGDLSTVTERTVIPDCGLVAQRAWVVVGNNCYFVSETRGVVGLQQTEQNKLQAVDLPLSEPIQDLIDRVNWRYGAGIRVDWWDSKLYVAVPLDNAQQSGANLATEIYSTGREAGISGVNGLNIGATYYFTQGSDEATLQFADGSTTTVSGSFVATATFVKLVTADSDFDGLPPTSTVQSRFAGVNSAILVYDFLNQAWQGRDDGPAMLPQEFLRQTIFGRERIFFVGVDGFVNLMEESNSGDTLSGGKTQFTTYMLTRGYSQQTTQFKRGRKMAVVIATWNPSYTLAVVYAGANKRKAFKTGETKDRTLYYKPWNAPAYDATNVNDDHALPNRQDYSLVPPFYPGGGVVLDTLQETRESVKLVGNPSRYVQIEITNTQGRLELRATEEDAQVTERRKGVQN